MILTDNWKTNSLIGYLSCFVVNSLYIGFSTVLPRLLLFLLLSLATQYATFDLLVSYLFLFNHSLVFHLGFHTNTVGYYFDLPSGLISSHQSKFIEDV